MHAGKDALKGLALYFACGYSVYYFIAVIVQYYLLAPLLTNVKRGGGRSRYIHLDSFDNVNNLYHASPGRAVAAGGLRRSLRPVAGFFHDRYSHASF